VSAVSFDSNILIDALNGVEAAQVILEQSTERWISRVTWIEVMSKVDERTVRPTELLLGAFDIDELTPEISRRAAALRNLRHKLQLPDAVILASAQANGRVLVTRNTRDFPPGSAGIHIPYTLHG
jgi:predicted nucleic acid-binding protein